jgi:hypothetical protein
MKAVLLLNNNSFLERKARKAFVKLKVKLCLKLIHLQRKRLGKHLLNKNANCISLFGALFCVCVRGLERWKWPGPVWTSEKPCIYVLVY